jgi:polysaccharide deacetylase 2 family uncharacterized protein YibQ
MIAIIIDDLGNQKIAGERVVALPGPVACAIMPHTAHATYLAQQAHTAGKEVMLHLPMQPMEMGRVAGPGDITLDTSRSTLRRILDTDLQDVPYTVGINNHMGSLITRHPGHMEWLMDELRERGNLFFVDSYTTASSVALQTARAKGVPAARRNVFLDNDAAADIDQQFKRLKALANRDGSAIGIGHPYPATLAYLEAKLPQLAREGYRLVPVSTIVNRQSKAYAELTAAAVEAL